MMFPQPSGFRWLAGLDVFVSSEINADEFEFFKFRPLSDLVPEEYVFQYLVEDVDGVIDLDPKTPEVPEAPEVHEVPNEAEDMEVKESLDRETIRNMKIDVMFDVAKRMNALFDHCHPWIYHTVVERRFEDIESMEARLAEKERIEREERGDPGSGHSRRACREVFLSFSYFSFKWRTK
mgnify:CR=1 FL=1